MNAKGHFTGRAHAVVGYTILVAVLVLLTLGGTAVLAATISTGSTGAGGTERAPAPTGVSITERAPAPTGVSISDSSPLPHWSVDANDAAHPGVEPVDGVVVGESYRESDLTISLVRFTITNSTSASVDYTISGVVWGDPDTNEAAPYGPVVMTVAAGQTVTSSNIALNSVLPAGVHTYYFMVETPDINVHSSPAGYWAWGSGSCWSGDGECH